MEGQDSPVGHEDEEEKLLKQSIALSLEGGTGNDNEEEGKTSFHPSVSIQLLE